MLSKLYSSFSAVLLVFLITLSTASESLAQTGHWLTGYYATYNYGVMSTSQLDYTKLTHVIYWPVIPNSGAAGSATAPGTLNTTPFGLSPATFSQGAADLITRSHAAGAKALIGIGGDVSSGATAGFQLATSPTYRTTFINNIVALVQEYGFDGVDINWEQIQTSDNSNFTGFITSLHAALQTASPTVHLLLTMPPETKPNGGRPDLLTQVYQDLDQVNIQTYQMSGPYCGWETWYNSPLNNGGATFILASSEQLPSVTNAIADYTSVGIPASKLAMGIQFDSEIWAGGQGTSTGGVTQPKQTWTGDGNNAYCSATNPAAPSISTLAYRLMITTLATTAGYTTNFDSVADQSWLSYDPSGTGVTNEANDRFVSFDSPTSIAKKGVDLSPVQTGVGGALGGVFIFELSGDFASTAPAASQHPLLNAAHSMQVLLPGLVTNLTAAAGAASVTLNWTAANGATSYKIFFSPMAGQTGTLASTVSTTQATVSTLTPGQAYWLQVQPVNAFGTGIATPQVSATIPALPAPVITWAAPASIPYGTPLPASHLNATASVPGTFVYTPAAGAILPIGTTTVTVTFTPSSASYSVAKASVSQVVTAAALSTSDAFGSLTVGTESNAQAISVNVPAASQIISVQVLTLGAAGLDFQQVSGSTCIAGKTLTAGVSVCSVNVTFRPTASGTRSGAVVVGTATKIATTYIDGTGLGPQLAYDPGTVSNIALPMQISPFGVALDGARNAYFSNYNYQQIIKVTPSGAYSTYVSGLSGQPTALALDGAGNLYITLTTTVVKVTPAGVLSTFVTGLIAAPKGLAVDPTSGVLYVANTNANTIIKVTPAGVQSTFLSGTVLGSKLTLPTGLAVDIAGNVYISDTGNNRILKVTAAGLNPVLLPATGLNAPRGLALGGTGNLYIVDQNNNRVLKLAPAGVQTVVLSSSVLATTLSSPLDVAVDSSQDLYVTDFGNARLLKLNRSTPPALSFATTYVGSTSADSPKSITLENIGNASLTFGTPAPTAPVNFAFGSATTCLVATLAAAQSCRYAVDFVPASAGANIGSLTATDNVLNIAGSHQVFPLSATGTALTTARVILGGLTGTYTGVAVPAAITTSPAGLGVRVTYGGSATVPTTAGSYAVVATVTTSGYTGSATGTLVISKATPVVTWPTPAAVISGTVLSATQLNASSKLPGVFVYSPAAGTVPPVGTDTLSTTFTPTDKINYNAATAKVSLTVTAAAAPRVVWVPDFYGSLLQVRVGTTPTAITINLPNCNPNSVAVNNNKAYVVCSSFNANPDKILVYNAATIRAAAAGTLTISPLQTITSSQFNSLIGITFDASNNLWVASYGNNQIESISAATLNTATPVITTNLINSPNQPVSLAFDPSGSLWVVGDYDGGILLHFPVSQLHAGASAVPDYCLATVNVGSGCQYIDNVFLSPEGLALFQGDVWVANNSTGAGGNVPGRELVDLKYAAGKLTVNATFGNSSVPADAPFVCPGGLYASATHLWVNDASYGETNPQCGAAGDVAGKTGGVFSFTPAQLTAKTTTVSQVLAFSNITSRPGFGGVFVENDQ